MHKCTTNSVILKAAGRVFYLSDSAVKREVYMAEHIMHKKENKKAPQKTLKEKREEKKNKKKGQNSAE